MSEFIDRGYPFVLLCLDCGAHYEGCFIDQFCPRCWNCENIRWTLKYEFWQEIKNPHECTMKNFKPQISVTVSL